MARNRPQIIAGDGHRRPGKLSGSVTMAGASAPTAVDGDITSAARLVTAGAVPFLRVTMKDPVKQSTMHCVPSVRGATFAHVQHDPGLTATVGGASNGTTQIDFRFYDAAGADIEPPNGLRLVFHIDDDLGG